MSISTQKPSRFNRLFIALIGGLGLALTVNAAEPANQSLIQLPQGQLQGALDNGVLAFKNIPYAEAPDGALRWKAPRPAAAWDGIRDASKFGAACPMVDGKRMAEGLWVKEGGADLFIGVPLDPTASEDCLHLNLWVPTAVANAPVMVWLQPQGGASMPLFDGSSFARDGVILVTLDYRQLTLGNFAHPALTAEATADEALGRFQTMDQLAALRWVKQNIAAFGGDASNVTVFGESAGGASVLQLLTLPAAKGLIDKAIAQSGVGWWTPFTQTNMEQLGVLQATYAGLPGKDATAEQLRALPASALPQVGVYNIDGRLQAENATVAIDEGRLLDVPLLIGWNDFDGSSLRSTTPEAVASAAAPALLEAYADDKLAGADLGYQLYTDSHTAAPARWIARKAAGGAPSYLYQYSYVLSLQRGKNRGASHGSEIPFVFDIWNKAFPQLPLTDEDRAAAKLMHSCWVSFARTGAPQCDGAPAWPAYNTDSDQLMQLGQTPRVLEHFRQTQLDAQEAAWRAGADAEDAETTLHHFEELLQKPAVTQAN